jgi:hypothetical protein
MTDIVERLNRIDIDDQGASLSTLDLVGEAAAEIERLRKKCNDQAMILRRSTPDKYPDTLFIHSELGTKDANGMPEKLLVVPGYGVDFSYVYEKTSKITGPEW